MSPMINDPVFGDPMNPESGNSYGATVTKRGRALIAKILAEKMPLTITRTMVGSGSVPGPRGARCRRHLQRTCL